MRISSDDESERVSTLKGYGLLDTPNEPEFDAIVREAAAAMGTEVALVSLVDEHRQWFKAKIGLAATETPRSISFCTHAIRGREVFIVEDASLDQRFANNPLVTGDPNIRFYCGAPLEAPDGKRIGTLCVLGDKPRATPTPQQTAKLAELACRTVAAFEKRKKRMVVLGGSPKQ